MLGNDKNLSTVLYMVRWFLTQNVTDPLSATSRGSADYTQYFSGNNASGQINYLERKLPTTGKAVVQVLIAGTWTTKTENTDYTLSRSGMTLTWTGYTPATASDNIEIVYNAINPWIYDDNPNLDSNKFPRISVLEVGKDNATSGQGSYQNYDAGPGDKIVRRIKIIVRNKRGPQTYILNGIHYKNYDLVQAISEQIEELINTNRVPPFWLFWDIAPTRGERIYSEEDMNDVIRYDITAELTYYRHAAQ